ncbi:helix-turn-helix domain-containing protein [Clostridium beijerinckii]|uniref:helix-turn-helix domain-containing protein n=1 Tax=Clostridium beijerinckii TaxID=1520 RepID=UPI000AE0725B|nr:helix-turn-helix domain-containing protein [Clostridium beijerinckii]
MYEEKAKIVSLCIANNNDYEVTVNKLKVSYQQVCSWGRKYTANGYEVAIIVREL